MRRSLDLALASTGLIVLTPLMVIIWVAIRMETPGPGLFFQRRVGRDGIEFWIVKFRSMAVAASNQSGPKVTAGGDARVTRTGRLLRSTKLDELPQLWNVMRGDMSLVGPRPEVPEYVARYTEDQRRVLSVRPGITSRATLEYVDEEALLAEADNPESAYLREVMPRKIELCLKDLDDQSVSSYLATLSSTLIGVVSKAIGRSAAKPSSAEVEHLAELPEDAPLAGYSVEWCAPERTLVAKRERLFEVHDGRIDKRPIATFPSPAWRRVAARSRFAQRLLRFSYYNVLPRSGGDLFATFDRSVGVLRGEQFTPLSGLRRPTRVLRGGCAVAPDGTICFGEYVSNPERGPIHIYALEPASDRAQVVHTFPAGAVRHVHGVHYDRFADEFICMTGDIASECRILRTSDRFASVQMVGEGDETWRCVALIATRDAYWYATDAEYAPNSVYRIDRETGERVRLGGMPGPTYGARETRDGILFSVAAELCPSQTDRHASLWLVAHDGSLSCLGKLRKDHLPNRYFQHGTINFAQGPPGSRVYLNGVALEHADNRVLCASEAA